MRVSIKGADKIAAELKKRPSDVRYALQKAVIKTAEDVKQAEISEMKLVFDRPTPFTLNALRIDTDFRESSIRAHVRVKDSERLGEKHFLWPEIFGGTRSFKRVEVLLRNRGILPAGYQVVPAKKNEWLDQSGNIPGREFTQILSSLQAFTEVGFKMNRTDKSRGQSKYRYFVKYSNYPKRGGRPVGIWERIGAGWTNVKPVLIFVHRAQYKPRFDFYGVAHRTVSKKFNGHFNRALEQRKGKQ